MAHFFKNWKKKYIADWAFYKYVAMICIPLIAQNLITNFVSMLDNIMVGQVGTLQMSAVSIVNQYVFIFNITIFGALAGPGIFGTQFFGKQDAEGQQYTVRYRLIAAALITALFSAICLLFGEQLLNLFISKGDAPELREETLRYGMEYLRIMILGFPVFALGQVYASAVRECGETKIPMYGSLSAIGINLVLDYGLIFGKFGLPELGVAGAAIATVIAKLVEAVVIIGWTHIHAHKILFVPGLYKGFHIPADLVKRMTVKSVPLLFNEFLWSLGMSAVAQCYSVRGLDVVAARNIASTIVNLIGVVYIQMSCGLGIIVGMRLGAGKFEEARDACNKIFFISSAIMAVIGVVMIPLAYAFPNLYNTEQHIKDMAAYFIFIQGITMPIYTYTNNCYFALRSGGKTGFTFLFDFVFTWFLLIPLTLVLTRFTTWNIYLVYTIVTLSELIKVVIGHFMVKSDIWVQNIVD